MNIFESSQNWYTLFFAFLVSWFALLLVRRKYGHKIEVTEQAILALSGLFVLALMEFFAVSTDLWHYVPGDWPLMLWPTYLVAILFGYQLLRITEAAVKRPKMQSQPL
jgi:hypothetical protein